MESLVIGVGSQTSMRASGSREFLSQRSQFVNCRVFDNSNAFHDLQDGLYDRE